MIKKLTFKEIILKLYETNDLTDEEYKQLIMMEDPEAEELLKEKARQRAQENYGKDIFVRGLIEFSSYCKNDCYYCGLRRSNKNAQRYRLKEEEIMMCCKEGYRLGFRTFVLQGGEDPWYTDERICKIVGRIRKEFPDCAITLSMGEKSKESYQKYFDAGANRYLLRHETANEEHYGKLHPVELSLKKRMQCLFDLKEIGYQVGCGFMVGSPYQTVDHLVEDLRFIQRLKPEMIGIGPFIPQKDTPFGEYNTNTADRTIRLLSILRLMMPKALIPATTALGTIHPMGREQGVLAGANVIMPNLSPVDVRKKYLIYDGKICTGEEAAQCRGCLERRMESIGYKVVVSRGDFNGN